MAIALRHEQLKSDLRDTTVSLCLPTLSQNRTDVKSIKHIVPCSLFINFIKPFRLVCVHIKKAFNNNKEHKVKFNKFNNCHNFDWKVIFSWKYLHSSNLMDDWICKRVKNLFIEYESTLEFHYNSTYFVFYQTNKCDDNFERSKLNCNCITNNLLEKHISASFASNLCGAKTSIRREVIVDNS